METKTQTIRLYAVLHDGDTNPHFNITSTNMDDVSGWTPLSTQTVEFDLPSRKSYAPMVIEGILETQAQARADFSVTMTGYDNQVASMLSIEHEQADIDSLDSMEFAEVKL